MYIFGRYTPFLFTLPAPTLYLTFKLLLTLVWRLSRRMGICLYACLPEQNS
jgi:hypothetical protein